MASEFLAVGDGCGRIAPRSLMEAPTAKVEIGEVEKSSLSRELSAGYSVGKLVGEGRRWR
jgi:hypothetical protein